jgi:hypothetical protein
MLQTKRKPGRPPKIGEKAVIRLQFQVYPHEAQLIYDWMERYDVGQTDAFRQMVRLATETANERDLAEDRELVVMVS